MYGTSDPAIQPPRLQRRGARAPRDNRPRDAESSTFPSLLTADDLAARLRTTRVAIYSMAERGRLPGIVRIGRRLLFREDALVEWLRQNTAPSAEG